MSTRHEVPAFRIRQSAKTEFYSFVIDGKLVDDFATVARVRRTAAKEMAGYQRTEVFSHIAEIRDYVESEHPLLPNAVVFAFDTSVRFTPTTKTSQGPVTLGTLSIPLARGASSPKPGFVVDGQQRLAAIRSSTRSTFPVAATAFINDSIAAQVEQFILINATKPLSRALIHELLPGTEGKLPVALERRRYPAFLAARLNHDADSPLKTRIQTPTNPSRKGTLEGTIKDNSVMRMIEHSLSDGVMGQIAREQPETATEPILDVLKAFWGAVSDVFPEAWASTPQRSRLVHGVGIVALGFLLEEIVARIGPENAASREILRAELQTVAKSCAWMDGSWAFGKSRRGWDELQNTSKDIQLLSEFLVESYRRRARFQKVRK